MAILNTRLAFNGYEANVSDLPEQSIAAPITIGIFYQDQKRNCGHKGGHNGHGRNALGL